MTTKQVEINLPKNFPWQDEVEKLSTEFNKLLICVPRQSGKSKWLMKKCCKALIAGKVVMLVVPKFEQAKNIFDDICKTLSGLLLSKNKTDHEATFVTGGKFLFRSGNDPDSLRGQTVDVLVFDEFAFSSQEAWETVEATTITRKDYQIIISSTPDGHNHFWDLYIGIKNGDVKDWGLYHRTKTLHPNTTEAQVEEKKATMTLAAWEQEYHAKFTSPALAHFPKEYFEDDIWVNDLPDTHHRNIIAIDPALGKNRKTGDYTAIVYTRRLDGIWYINAHMERMPAEETVMKLRGLIDYHKGCEFLAVETNSAQWILADSIRRLFPDVQLYEIVNKVDKNIRIARLGYYLKNKLLKFIDNPMTRIIVNQLMDWPMAKNDDGPDAVEMALRLDNDLNQD